MRGRSLRGVCLVLTGLTSAAAPALAAQRAGDAGNRSRIDVTVPPPGEPVGRTYHVHRGFYLRGSVGVGWLGGTFDHDAFPRATFGASGLNAGADLMIGGSPTPGLAIGGALFTDTSFSARFERDDRDAGRRNLGTYMVGPFVDGFFDPKRGWHLGGAIGLTRIEIEDEPTAAASFSSMNAFGVAALFGHDWWAGESWSVGTTLRGLVAFGKGDDNSGRTGSVSVLVTALYY